jgi:putative FmdB family regulatory protein
MPIYLYRCEKCGCRFELKQPFGGQPPKKCPSDGCSGKVVRVFTPPTIIFKGPGFHVTDYGRGSGGNGKRKEPSKFSETAEKIRKEAEAAVEKE